MVVKRGLDIGTSAILLLLALPSLLIAALIIRLTSKGPILFRQRRMGRNFKPFEILKLRTMEFAAPGLAYTLGADPRITPFGRFLRRSKLDEVPQLWNVLRGDMSLVGPRPVVPELTEEFRAQYARLLRVRPGLTDPASLKYSQEARLLGTVPDPMGFFKSVVTPDKISISLRYVERSNLWTDGMTLAMTALICCFPALSRYSGRWLDPQPEPVRSWRPPLLDSFSDHAGRVAGFSERAFSGQRMASSPNQRNRGVRDRKLWNPSLLPRNSEESTVIGSVRRVSRL